MSLTTGQVQKNTRTKFHLEGRLVGLASVTTGTLGAALLKELPPVLYTSKYQ